tara:strand:- start:109 stop:2802 length:2694 start_codon:yes stop_codon:yes gene_type:complete
MSTIKISELATGAVTLESLLAFADNNGIAFKGNVSELNDFISTLAVSGLKGAILTTDPAPTEDGLYPCSESGTYTNFDSLIIDISNTLSFISVSGTQTIFAKVEIPISIIIDSTPTSGSNNAVESNGVFDAIKLNQPTFNTIDTTINSLFAKAILYCNVTGYDATDLIGINELTNITGNFCKIKIGLFSTKAGSATNIFDTGAITPQTGVVRHTLTNGVDGESATIVIDWDVLGSVNLTESTWTNCALSPFVFAEKQTDSVTENSNASLSSGGAFNKINQLQKPFSNLGTDINSKYANSILFVNLKGFLSTDFLAITELSNSGFGRIQISKFSTKGGLATLVFDTSVIAVQTGVVTHEINSLTGESATIIIDWDAFGSSYLSTSAWSNGGFDISTYTKLGLVNPLGFQFPFTDSLVNDYLLSLVKDIKIYGGETGHEYIISRLEIQAYRVTVAIKDLTDNVVVCSYAYTATINDYNTLPSVWQLDGALEGSTAGVYAFVTFDWSKAVTGTTDYTTIEQSGVYKSNIFTKYDVLDYLHDDKIKQVVTVGVGKDFSTLRLAVESLNNSFGLSWGSSYHNQVMFLLDEGTFNATFLDIPKFCTVKGQGIGVTRIERENTNPNAMFEAHFECKFQDLTIFSESNQYCIHSDDFNRVSQGNRLLRQRFDNVELLGGSANFTPLFGSGLSSGQIMLFNNCSGGHDDLTGTNTGVTFSSHNTSITPSVEDSKIILNNCTSTDYNGVLMISLGSGGNQSELEINSCKFYNVATAITGGVVEEWIVSGNTDCVYEAPTMLGGNYANIGVKFSGLNNTGVTIPAGTFVERTATKTIAVATTTDDVFGFVEKDILNGASGTVITSKLFHKNWVLGTKSNGKFGITSGAIDMSATDKKGFIIDNDVTLY